MWLTVFQEIGRPATDGNSGNDPFGGATADVDRMNKLAQERLEREKEREARREAEKKQLAEKRQREREEREV